MIYTKINFWEEYTPLGLFGEGDVIAELVQFQVGRVSKASTHTLVMVSHTLKAYTAIFSGSILYLSAAHNSF